MILVTIDSVGWKTSEARCIRAQDATFNPFYFEDELRNVALAENIHYIGLQKEFRRDWEENRRELHWGHWNYEGHKLVATLLAEKIQRMLEGCFIVRSAPVNSPAAVAPVLRSIGE